MLATAVVDTKEEENTTCNEEKQSDIVDLFDELRFGLTIVLVLVENFGG